MHAPHESRSIVPAGLTAVAARAATAPPALSAAPDALGLLKSLRRRAGLALGLGLLAAAVVGAAAYVLVPPAKYTARAMLHVSSEQPRILAKTGEVHADFAAYQKTQLAMLKSRLVLGAALKQPEVARLEIVRAQAEPIEWLEKELLADFANGSEMFRISFSSKDAREPAVIVNAVVQAYMDEVVNVEAKRRVDRRDMLKAAWDRYQENLKAKRAEVRTLTMTTGSDDKQALAILRSSEAERLAKASDELAKVQGELRSLRLEHDILDRSTSTAGTGAAGDAAVEDMLNTDPKVVELTNAADKARARYEQVRRVVRDLNDPSLARPMADHKAARAALADLRERLRPLAAERLRGPGQPGGGKLAALRERIEVLTGLEGMLTDDVKRLSERGRTMTQASVDLTATREEIAYADDLAKKIGAEVELLNLELQAPPRIRPHERAEEPRTKDELRQAKVSGAAAFGAFAAALFGVSFWEFRSRRVDSAEDVAASLGLRIVGTLPALPKGRAAAQKEEAYQGRMIESVDAARTALMHAARLESLRVVMVGSAMGGEGKTSLACHLAASLARAGRTTLLVDCDLRRPAAHRLFDIPVGPGVSEVLRGEVAPEAAIRPAAPDLWLLPAGRCDAAAIQALARDELGTLFASVRHRYDFVVVDSPPVLPVADALQVGQHVDAVVFSIMRDVSQMPKVYAAYERLSSLGIRMLGAVVAGTRCPTTGGEYYYTAQPAVEA